MLSLITLMAPGFVGVAGCGADAGGESAEDFATTEQALTVGDRLLSGESLAPGAYKQSKNGRYTFRYQKDGNLVLYKDGTTALWASHTQNTTLGSTTMKANGNLCVVNGSGANVWCSGTANNPGAIAIVGNDGTVKIYSAEGEMLWDTYKGVDACNANTFTLSNSTSGSATCSYVGQPCTTSTGYYGTCWKNLWGGLYCGTN